MPTEITCIITDNNGIVTIGAGSRRLSETEAIRRIENGDESFYVIDPEGDRAQVIVASRNGKKYLKTKSDKTTHDNLLFLPRCK